MKKILFILLSILAVLIAWWPIQHEANLRGMKELKNEYPSLSVPKEGVVLMVYAHSDDELGTIAAAAKLKRENPALRFRWYIVSDGGRGLIFPGTCGDLTKSQCRLSEAGEVSECAGLPKPESLNFPDGHVKEIKNLPDLLREKIPELTHPDVKYIFTHDNRGLYGHSDHLAVYDAVKSIAKEKNIPLVTLALPQYFKDRLILTDKAKSRSENNITHALVMNQEDLEIKVCATEAHASQKLILNLLMFQGVGPRKFFEAAPREFLNLD